jgi:hypothetical protein
MKLFVLKIFNKNVICNVLLMMIEVQLVFLLSKSSGLHRSHPLPPPPHRVWGRSGSFPSSSHSYSYGSEAVSLRVKI